jgi:hypothetical protein
MRALKTRQEQSMNRRIFRRNNVHAYALGAAMAVAAALCLGALLTYRMANTTGIVVAQFLQAGATSAQ